MSPFTWCNPTLSGRPSAFQVSAVFSTGANATRIEIPTAVDRRPCVENPPQRAASHARRAPSRSRDPSSIVTTVYSAMDPNASCYVTGLVGSAVTRRLEAAGFTNILTATRQQLDLRDQAEVSHGNHTFLDRAMPEQRRQQVKRVEPIG